MTHANLTDLKSDIFVENGLTVGFLRNVQLSEDFLNELVMHEVSFFYNLEKPQDIKTPFDESKEYYGFYFVFAPFNTSNVELENQNVNMADLIVFKHSDVEVLSRCGNKKERLSIYSQSFNPVESVPVFREINRPVLNSTSNLLSFSDHFGTHWDSPYHFIPNGADTSSWPGQDNSIPCIKISLKTLDQEKSFNYSVTKDDLLAFEKTNTLQWEIPDNALIMIETGFRSHWLHKSVYQTNFPGLSMEAAKFLVENRKAVAIAMDSLALDPAPLASDLKFPVHQYLAKRGVMSILNIGGELDYAAGLNGRCVVSFMRMEKGTGSPVAIFGLPDLPTGKPVHEHKEEEADNSRAASASSLSISFFAIALAALVNRV